METINGKVCRNRERGVVGATGPQGIQAGQSVDIEGVKHLCVIVEKDGRLTWLDNKNELKEEQEAENGNNN